MRFPAHRALPARYTWVGFRVAGGQSAPLQFPVQPRATAVSKAGGDVLEAIVHASRASGWLGGHRCTSRASGAWLKHPPEMQQS